MILVKIVIGVVVFGFVVMLGDICAKLFEIK